MRGLASGEYVLRATGLAGAIVKSIMWNGRDYSTQLFDASAGMDFEDVVVTFTRSVARIVGTTRDARGRVSPARVVLFPIDRTQWSRYGFYSPRLLSTSSMTDGTFRLDTVPAGEYLVVADAASSGGWPDPIFLQAASTLASRTTLKWGDVAQLDLLIRAVRRPGTAAGPASGPPSERRR